MAIERWISSVLKKLVHYKAEHQRLVKNEELQPYSSLLYHKKLWLITPSFTRIATTRVESLAFF